MCDSSNPCAPHQRSVGKERYNWLENTRFGKLPPVASFKVKKEMWFLVDSDR